VGVFIQIFYETSKNMADILFFERHSSIFLIGVDFMNKLLKANKKIEKAVVTGYKVIEKAVVTGYKKIEFKFVKTFLTPESCSVDKSELQ
jgi:hypothetical protein